MRSAQTDIDRKQTTGEEIANSISHGIGLIAAITGAPFLIMRAAGSGDAGFIAGGLSYTLGVVFFVTDSKVKYGHFIWHLFVLSGTTCHYFAVLWYAH